MLKPATRCFSNLASDGVSENKRSNISEEKFWGRSGSVIKIAASGFRSFVACGAKLSSEIVPMVIGYAGAPDERVRVMAVLSDVPLKWTFKISSRIIACSWAYSSALSAEIIPL